MCGRYAIRCSTERFLRFLGSTDSEGGYSPFKIRYVLLNDDHPSQTIIDHLGKERQLQRSSWKTYRSCNE